MASDFVLSADVIPLHEEASELMRRKEFKPAISHWQRALAYAESAEERAYLRASRSACYSEFSKHLRSIPAQQSEARAQFAADPTQLASLALQDADKALAERPGWADALLRRGQAQLLLEEYDDAERTFLQVLGDDPDNGEAQGGLQAIKAAAALGDGAPSRKRRLKHDADDLECSICCKLFYKPVTTPCGHTFCHACFARAMDHNSRCPICRRVLHTGRDLPVTNVLHNLILKHFPAEAEERRRESAGAGGRAEDEGGLPPLPMFVMAPMLPFEKMALNIFEPRYRLMVRRCMEGHKQLAVTCSVQTPGGGSAIPPVATQCKIEECQLQPDGRYHLELVGVQRIKVVEGWELDGYRVCQPEKMADDAPADDLTEMCTRVDGKVEEWLGMIRAAVASASGPARASLMTRLTDFGAKPPTSDPEAFSFWVANVVTLSAADKLRAILTARTSERLELLLEYLEDPQRMHRVFGGSCSIM